MMIRTASWGPLLQDQVIRELEGLFDELNAKHFQGRLSRIPISLNKCRGCFGRYTYTYMPLGIQISRFHVALNPFRSQGQHNSVEETLLHEMIHHEEFTFHGRAGHGSHFRSRAAMSGLKTYGEGQVPQGRHVYECPTCKNRWHRHRAWKGVRSCGRCKATIVKVKP